MKKDFIFSPILLVVGILLCLLKATGMTAHIIISLIGVIALVVYTILTVKSWKILPLEISMRASYGVALITGIVLKIKYLAIIGILHKIFAILFVLLLIALFIVKLVCKNKK